MNKITIGITALLMVGLLAGAIIAFGNVSANKATVAGCDGGCTKEKSCGSSGCGSTTTGSCGCSKTTATVSGNVDCACGCKGTCNGSCGSANCTCKK